MLSCSARYFPAAPCSHRIPRRTRRVAPVRSTPKDNMSIQEYIEEHGLGKKVEDVINAAVKAKAAEPISFMVRPGESNHRFGKRRLKDPGWIGARRRGMDPRSGGSISRSDAAGQSRVWRSVRRTLARRVSGVARARRVVRSRFRARIASRFVPSAACRRKIASLTVPASLPSTLRRLSTSRSRPLRPSPRLSLARFSTPAVTPPSRRTSTPTRACSAP